MSVSRAELSSLKPEDIRFAAMFLERIFIKQEQDINIEDKQKLHVLTQLIKAYTNSSSKLQLFSKLSIQSQHHCFRLLSYKDQSTMLYKLHSISLTFRLFQTLSDDIQKQFLIDCYKHDETRFLALKRCLKPSYSMRQGIMIDRAAVGERQLNAYCESLMAYVQDSSFSSADTLAYFESIQAVIEDRDADYLIQRFFKSFLNLQLQLNSKEAFKAYLSFFTLAVPMVVLCPNHTKHLERILDIFLIALMDIQKQGDEWVITLLNQLPLFILRKCCFLVSNYDQIKQLNKRKLYLRLFSIIERYRDHEKATHIKMALNQL